MSLRMKHQTLSKTYIYNRFLSLKPTAGFSGWRYLYLMAESVHPSQNDDCFWQEHGFSQFLHLAMQEGYTNKQAEQKWIEPAAASKKEVRTWLPDDTWVGADHQLHVWYFWSQINHCAGHLKLGNIFENSNPSSFEQILQFGCSFNHELGHQHQTTNPNLPVHSKTCSPWGYGQTILAFAADRSSMVLHHGLGPGSKYVKLSMTIGVKRMFNLFQPRSLFVALEAQTWDWLRTRLVPAQYSPPSARQPWPGPRQKIRNRRWVEEKSLGIQAEKVIINKEPWGLWPFWSFFRPTNNRFRSIYGKKKELVLWLTLLDSPDSAREASVR